MHEHEHTHSHDHGHTHNHDHDHPEKEYSREEAVALLNYMYQHNTHHAEELSELAGAFPERIRYKLEDAVGVLDAANESLKDAIAAVEAEEVCSEEKTAESESVHEHSHDHGHVHDPKDKKKRISRISRIIGHLQYVRRMMEEDEDCSDILMQISAAKSALNGLGKTIIKEHMAHCIVHAVESGDTEAVQEFEDAIQKYL